MISILKNKKAYFEYTIIDKYIAGIQLTGAEVKSIRNSKASISEAHCTITNNEIFIVGMNVSPYENTVHPQDPIRIRKLLLKKVEINKLSKAIQQKGLTITPLSLFLSDTGFIKLEIALVKGKKIHDKRESIKEREIKKTLNNI